MTQPQVIETVSQMQRWSDQRRGEGLRIGFVPTMGYLHEGHLSLVRQARELSDAVVASIFVNPTQFGPNEDLARYPRDFDGDMAKLGSAGTDVVFFPPVGQMYPDGFCTYVRVEGLSDVLCGVTRPIHFRGVATVCLKLFNMVRPHAAVFGKKDFQQWRVIQQMVRDLNLDLQIVGAPIVREPDGLAMSSRNAYLSPTERRAALCIRRGLDATLAAFESGERDCGRLIALTRQSIESEPLARLDYASLFDSSTLRPLEGRVAGEACLAAAAWLGATRLIDNQELSLHNGR